MSASKDNSKVGSDSSSCLKLYACGYNGFRQVSSKEMDAIDVPVQLEFATAPARQGSLERVVKVECCLASTFILYGDGTVSVMGCTPGTSQPGRIDNLFPGQDVKDIACINDNVMVVTKAGKLLSWSDYLCQDSAAVEVKTDEDISEVSCGDLYTVFTTSDGCFGKVSPPSILDKEKDEEKDDTTFKVHRIVFGHQVQSVSCGKEHVVLLTLTGKVFSLGGGSRGQLGSGTLESQCNPTLIEALDGIHISQIASGGWHSAARSSSGDVYCWGWNKDGQVGVNDDDVQVQAVPVPVMFDNNDDIMVIDISCGTRHTAAVTSCGEVWTWGWGYYGQLGDTVKEKCHKPIKIPLTNVSRVWCSHWNTFILVKQDKQENT